MIKKEKKLEGEAGGMEDISIENANKVEYWKVIYTLVLVRVSY
jgi:hypothetical protein